MVALYEGTGVQGICHCGRLLVRLGSYVWKRWKDPAGGGFVQLKLSTRKVSDVLVVDCNGRVVFGEESAALRDTVKRLIEEKNTHLVLNLAGVTYIDSGGLGTLVGLYTTAQNAGGSLKLASLTQRVGDLLQVTKLVTIFEVFDSEEQAIESFRKGAAA
jgi:anti-sigma B factor antagonist